MVENVWFTSDQHFFHEKLLEYIPTRPKDYNQIMIDNWNMTINGFDIVYVLGDLTAGVTKFIKDNGLVVDSFQLVSSLVSELKGRKIFIRGNHDYFTNEQFVEMGFESCQETLELGEFFLTHYPMLPDKYMNEKMKMVVDKHLEIFNDSDCKYIIHGHSHETNYGGNRFNVAMDLNGYTPVNIDEIKGYFKQI